VSTKTSKTLGAKPSLGEGPWRTRVPLIAGFVGVGLVGVLIGRASSTVGESRAASTTEPSASATPEVQEFDLREDPQFKAGTSLRPMDRDILGLITSLRLERSQMRDVFPDRPYRVTFVGSIAEHRIGLVMIDFNRDGTFEERWDVKRSEVIRTVLQDPAAGAAAVRYTLAHGRWQPR
jgi:hypothetical protein